MPGDEAPADEPWVGAPADLLSCQDLKRRDSRCSADYPELMSVAPDANEPDGLVMVPLDCVGRRTGEDMR